MKIRVGINGFGRVGRQSLKAILEKFSDNIEIVAINDIADVQTNAHLLKYDSNYGRFSMDVSYDEAHLFIADHVVQVFKERDPFQIPWGKYGVDIVIESTGIFTDGHKAVGHIDAGAKKVIISAPAIHEDITIVMGVNERTYDSKKHRIISNASCTTNCLAVTLNILNNALGIDHGLMTTIHSYTNEQHVLDLVHKDLRRARAAAINVIPTTTGAAIALTSVLPALAGKMDGMSLRVPTPTVSLIDVVATVQKTTTKEAVNEIFHEAAQGALKSILAYTDEPLVSSDFKGDSHSATIDSLSTFVMKENMLKIIAWYDNEWAYASRVADLTYYIGNELV
jgi:glyceraldehyde 3-phosphate dehydrogenase